MSSKQTTRRQILRSIGLFGGAMMFSGVLAACASSTTDGPASASDDLVTCAAPVIANNHGHSLVVSAEDVAAGVSKTYDIQGTATHTHSLTLAAADFAKLALGAAVTVTSTTDARHSHDVTVTCAGAPAPNGNDAGVCAVGATKISANHGHVLTVPAADAAVAVTKTYGIQGTASPDHQITITSAQFASLAAGKTFDIASTNTFGHTHVVTVVCA